MKVLVVGHAGQVAQSLIEAAEAKAVTCVAQGRPQFDLTDAASIRSAIAANEPACVINAAAYTAVDKAETEPDQAYAVNAEGPGMLAEACNAADVPLIHLSTDYVYDGAGASAYTEDMATNPLGIYGKSKLAGEQAVLDAQPKSIILRTAWVYSPFGHNFLMTMLRLAETRQQLNVVDDQIGNPTYAPHIADALLDVAGQINEWQREHAPWGIYNLSGTGETSWCGFAREIFTQSADLGGPSASVQGITTAEYPTPAARPANSRLDCSKLASVFDVRLPSWQIGTRACLTRLLA